MIRINLLPVRQIKRVQKAKKEIIGFLASVLMLFAFIGIVAFTQIAQVNDLKAAIKSLKIEKNTYQSTINEIEKLKKDKATLEQKLSTIKKLKKGSKITVRVLDEIASLVPANRLWLKSLTLSSQSLNLTGVALDNNTIATYMDRIKDSPFFTSAELGNSSLVVVAGRKLKSFSLTCGVAIDDSAGPETEEKLAK